MSADLAALDDLVRLTEEATPRLAGCRVVCIDGPAGSGKTTLAGALVGALTQRGWAVAALHMDDFYEGWEGLRRELEPRLLRQVFEPLSRGESTRWQRYDWSSGRFDNWLDLEPAEVLVVEGCGSGARAYDPYRSVLAFVEAGRDTRLERGLRRDGAAAEPNWVEWMDREAAHFELNRTRERADLRTSTDPELAD